MTTIELDLVTRSATTVCACQPSVQYSSSTAQGKPEPWVPVRVAEPVDEADVPSSVCFEIGFPHFQCGDYGMGLTLFGEPHGSASEQCMHGGLLANCGVMCDYNYVSTDSEVEVAFAEWLSALDAEEHAKKNTCCLPQ